MPPATAHAQIAAPPPLIFLGYLVSALVLQLAVPFPLPGSVLVRILGLVLVVLGFLLDFSAVGAMRRAHTTPNPGAPVTALVTDGPYRFTRNPIYLGFLLIFLGITVAAGTLWGLLLSPFLIGTIMRWVIHPEEDYLAAKFEDEYRAYRSRVRQWV